MSTQKRQNEGFTLIEILIAIVVIGILSAVVVLGISSLTNKGKSTACTASADAAKAAATVHFANTGSYPADIKVMDTAGELTLPSGGSYGTGNLTYSANGWTMTMTAGTPPTFACS